MSFLNWFDAHNWVVTALGAIASAFFAWSIFRVERNRDLAANQVHSWVTGHLNPLIVIDEVGWDNEFGLQINLMNRSKLPIYGVRMKVKTTSKFVDSGFALPSRQDIYIQDENMVLGDLEKEISFLIRPEKILDSKLNEYLLATHVRIDSEEFNLEKLASHFAVEITFRDSSGKYWRRKTNGKLRRILGRFAK